jgi:hypothetical protein
MELLHQRCAGIDVHKWTVVAALNPNDFMVFDERGKRVGRVNCAYAKGGGDVWYWLILALAMTIDGSRTSTRGKLQRLRKPETRS